MAFHLEALRSSFNLQSLESSDLFVKVQKKLRENRWYKPVLEYAEDTVKVKREYLVCGAGVISTLMLLLGYGTALINGSVGFVYPAYKTLNELEHSNPHLVRKWLIYWFLHATLNFLEVFLFFLDWMPGYWFFKSLFLFWCYAPVQRNGSDIIYSYLIQPYFKQNQEAINNAINQVVKTAHSIYTETEPVSSGSVHDHQN